MESESLLKQATVLQGQLNGILSAFDIDEFSPEERKLTHLIKRLAIDARLDARDFEYAETRLEQTRLGATAVKTLERLRQAILAASEHNLFSAIDVAQITAHIEYMISKIRQE